jgi:transcriptional regulator GlxA family with amidase domain
VIAIVAFDTVLYNDFAFFPLLGMPPVSLPFNEQFTFLMREICLEKEKDRLGKEIIVKNYLQEMIIHIFRHIDADPALVHYIAKMEYLTDKRLMDIVKYIQENLEKDLSNKAIAKVAFVSEDYVGQFFKALTNRNLQDYIENQRLDKAMHMLKTMPMNIQEIATLVGFKDAAYFSRRFKLRFGKNANTVKSPKTHMA